MMHKRADAEQAIRHLALEWMHETGYRRQPGHYPSFPAFTTWLDGKGYSHYLRFRSGISAHREAEGWFEDEIRRYWRWVAD